MKKIILFVVLLFFLLGAVSASDNITNDTQETLSVDDTPTDNLTLEDDTQVLQNETSAENASGESHDSPSPAPGKLSVTTSSVTGTQGKYITLKAVVKNSSGPVKGIKVTFKLNGNTYTAVTDANGIATKTVKCPKSALQKTTTKKTKKRMTKTYKYSKTYTATASVETGASSTFKVISKKTVVKKYKVIKKKKTMKVPLKKGSKTYKKGKYKLFTYRGSQDGVYVFGALMSKKNTAGTIKFALKMHYKDGGKWHWSKWYKVAKNKEYTTWYPKYIKVNKITAKYTQESYKRIK